MPPKITVTGGATRLGRRHAVQRRTQASGIPVVLLATIAIVAFMARGASASPCYATSQCSDDGVPTHDPVETCEQLCGEGNVFSSVCSQVREQQRLVCCCAVSPPHANPRCPSGVLLSIGAIGDSSIPNCEECRRLCDEFVSPDAPGGAHSCSRQQCKCCSSPALQ